MKKWIVVVAFTTAAGVQYNTQQEVNEETFNSLTEEEKGNLTSVSQGDTTSEATAPVVDNDAEAENNEEVAPVGDLVEEGAGQEQA